MFSLVWTLTGSFEVKTLGGLQLIMDDRLISEGREHKRGLKSEMK